MNTKRLSAILIALAASFTLFAQGRVTTRKYRIADFQDKMTKVVLSQDEMLAQALRQEVINNWTSTVFEFCSLEQFETLKTNDNYYFLIPLESKFKGEDEPGIVFLTLLKGGAGASEGISEMFEVISLPLAPAAGVGERNLLYVGAIVKAVQEFTLAAMESENAAYKREAWFGGSPDKSLKKKDFYIADEDISASVSEKDLEKFKARPGFHIVSAADADEKYISRDPSAAVGFVVAPFIPSEGSFSYKLILDAGEQRLCNISRHKISGKNAEGFLSSDLNPFGNSK